MPIIPHGLWKRGRPRPIHQIRRRGFDAILERGHEIGNAAEPLKRRNVRRAGNGAVSKDPVVVQVGKVVQGCIRQKASLEKSQSGDDRDMLCVGYGGLGGRHAAINRSPGPERPEPRMRIGSRKYCPFKFNQLARFSGS